MQSNRWMVCLVCGLPLLLLAGCFRQNPYGPYGPGGYPGVYGAPPAGSAVPNGVIMQPAPAQTLPGTSAPSWQESQDPVPPSLNAPIPNSGTNNNLPVPEPRDLDSGSFGNGTNNLEFNKGGDADSPFTTPPAEQGSLRNTAQDALKEQVAVRSSTDDAAFVDPVSAEPATVEQVSHESDEPAARRLNPYDYDRKDFRWLRGVVDYDEADKTWNIIYDLNPDQADRYGGSITLSEDERLSKLPANSVVLVEGYVDTNTRDRSGKPIYRVEQLARLVPKDPKKQVAQSEP